MPGRNAVTLETGGTGRSVLPIQSLKGSNQSGMRAYNQRLVLSLVYAHRSLAKTDIARMTGLSAQTVSVIMRELESEDLLVRGEPIRGKVGQPSVPLSINPEGAYFIGLKVGRRSAELILLDFVGTAIASVRRSYPWPTPAMVVAFAQSGLADIIGLLPADRRSRIAGIGIAIPFELWNWTDQAGAPSDEMDQWRGCDLRAEIAAITDYPVYLQNDATDACTAELVYGRHASMRDYLYVYIGTFVGGGVVLNGSIFTGRTGYAGALAPMPVPGPDARTVQLIERASIMVLERMMRAAGRDPAPLWNSPDTWEGFEDLVEDWIGIVSRALAHAIVSASSVIDFEHVIIDGGLPVDIRARIVSRVREQILSFDLQGLVLPDILPGTIGANARAIGGASLPLVDKYLIDRNMLLGET